MLFKEKKSLSGRMQDVFQLLIPIVLYLTIQAVVMIATQFTIMGMGLFAVVTALIFYRLIKGTAIYGNTRQVQGKKGVVLFLPASIGLGIAMNVLMSVLELDRFSSSYNEVEEFLYSGSFAAELLISAFLIPIAEELVFRGAVLNQLEKWLRTVPAIVVSGLIFGLCHGNLVQGIYGMIMGCLFAYAVIRTGTLYVPILMHMAVNLVIILGLESGITEWILSSSIHSGAVLAASGVFCVGCINHLHKIQ